MYIYYVKAYTCIYKFAPFSSLPNKRNAYAVRFNPALIPIQPQTKKFDLVYHVPTSANTYFKQGTTIRAVVDTPYTVRQVGTYMACGSK